MNTKYSIGSSALIVGLLTSTASFADVTPQQVWDVWRNQIDNYSYNVTSEKTASGGTLTVSDLSIIMPINSEGAVTIEIDALEFIDLGNGTVMVSLPSTFPMNVRVSPAADKVADLALEYATTGFSMLASGTANDMTFAYSMDKASLRLKELVVDGEVIEVSLAEINMTDLAGNTTSVVGDLQSIVETVSAATLDYSFVMAKPGGGGNVMVKGQTTDLNISVATVVPFEYEIADINRALRTGLSINMQMSTGAGSSEFEFNDGETSALSTSATTGTSLSFAMDSDHLQYGFGATGLSTSIAASDIPLPIDFAADELGFNLSVPVMVGDGPQDFEFLTKIVGFVPSDMIWGLLDRTNALPHDPATVIVDLKGQANWLFNVLDPMQAAMMMDSDMPADLHSLTLNELKISAAGAELTGSGAFTFNNDDLETFGGIPAPDGTVDLKVVGANGLIDGLIAMGLMSDDDAMGARMMLGLFGRPGEGEDTMLSTIEVKANGQIFANGQRIQ